MIRTRCDERSWIVNHLNGERGVPRAAKVVGHNIAKLKGPRIGEQQIDVVPIVAHIYNARFRGAEDVVDVACRVPVGTVRAQTNHGGERGDAGDNLRVEINAPLKQRTVVRSPLVDDIEGPDAIQRAAYEVTQIPTREVSPGRHRVCHVGIIGIIQHPLSVHVPGIVEPFHVHNA